MYYFTKKHVVKLRQLGGVIIPTGEGETIMRELAEKAQQHGFIGEHAALAAELTEQRKQAERALTRANEAARKLFDLHEKNADNDINEHFRY